LVYLHYNTHTASLGRTGPAREITTWPMFPRLRKRTSTIYPDLTPPRCVENSLARCRSLSSSKLRRPSRRVQLPALTWFSKDESQFWSLECLEHSVWVSSTMT
jgi:hypothetical protein